MLLSIPTWTAATIYTTVTNCAAKFITLPLTSSKNYSRQAKAETCINLEAEEEGKVAGAAERYNHKTIAPDYLQTIGEYPSRLPLNAEIAAFPAKKQGCDLKIFSLKVHYDPGSSNACSWLIDGGEKGRGSYTLSKMFVLSGAKP